MKKKSTEGQQAKPSKRIESEPRVIEMGLYERAEQAYRTKVRPYLLGNSSKSETSEGKGVPADEQTAVFGYRQG